jgi:hypothetical protein
MRVLLAGPDFEENLSIRYLASSLQAKRHETSLAVFNLADDVAAVAEQAGEVEIVGLSVCKRLTESGTNNFSPPPLPAGYSKAESTARCPQKWPPSYFDFKPLRAPRKPR